MSALPKVPKPSLGTKTKVLDVLQTLFVKRLKLVCPHEKWGPLICACTNLVKQAY